MTTPKKVPKIDPDSGSTITCKLCYGQGCSYCDGNGVEMVDNPEYWESKVDDLEYGGY